MPPSSDTSDPANVKSRRPAESAFKQQRLPAWQPILTAGTVLPTFFVIGIAFIPVGIGLLYFSDEVKEYVIDYTTCIKDDDPSITCADFIKQTDTWMDRKCFCELEVNLTEDFKAEVYFYYGLSNYYQNHRRYVKSRDDSQLLGRLGQAPSSDCEPFAYHDENGVNKPVAPCGAIANSLFNDTLTLYSKELQKDVPVFRTGIAWNSDKEIKFRNPDTSAYNGSLKAAFANYTKPANWAVHVWELDLNNTENNGFQNEDLIVWMRTAALPTFRKLYRRVDHTKTGFRTGLNKGPYTLKVEYNYPVTDFKGTKSFIISTTSLLGGKNPFLGVAYVVVGTLCLLLGIVLLIVHVKCSRKYFPTPNDTFFLNHYNSQTARPPDKTPELVQGAPTEPLPVSSLLENVETGSDKSNVMKSGVQQESKNVQNDPISILPKEKSLQLSAAWTKDVVQHSCLCGPSSRTDLVRKRNRSPLRNMSRNIQKGTRPILSKQQNASYIVTTKSLSSAISIIDLLDPAKMRGPLSANKVFFDLTSSSIKKPKNNKTAAVQTTITGSKQLLSMTRRSKSTNT